MAAHSSIFTWRIPTDRGAWRATVQGVPKSRTRLKRLSSSSTYIYVCVCVFPASSVGEESACNAGDLGLIPWLGRSVEGHGNPLQYSFLENPHGQRSLMGHSPWGHKVGHD